MSADNFRGNAVLQRVPTGRGGAAGDLSQR